VLLPEAAELGDGHFPGRNGKAPADAPLVPLAPFAHPEPVLRLRHDDHRLPLAVDVPAPAGGMNPPARLVDFLDLLLLSPLPQQPARRGVDAGIGIITVQP